MIRIEEKFNRGLEGCSTHFDYITTLSLSKFTSLLSADCKTYVLGRNPKDGMAAAHLADEFYRVNSWKPRSSYFTRFECKDNDYSSRPNLKKDWVRSEQISGQDRRPNNYLTEKNNFTEKAKDRKNYTNGGVTCYGCGQPGHKKPDCLNKVRRLRSPKPKGNIMYVSGKIGDMECQKMVVDSGADLSSVHPDYVPKALYTGDHTTIRIADGTPRKCPLAKVWFHLGECSVQKVVVVFSLGSDDALLGMDLNMHKFLIQLHEDQQVKEDFLSTIRLTRKQEAEEAEQEKLDDEATANSVADPVNLDQIYSFEDSLFDEEEQDDDNHDQVQGTPAADEDILQLPLPVPEEGTEERALFIQQQEDDPSLANIRRLADQQQRGYKRENGLIVHMEQDELSTYWTRVVAPKARRKNILTLAHSNPMAGHCGVKKTAARLKRTFTWPGMSTDVKVVCASCPQCQKAARNDQGRAPLVPLPVITVPFARLAFDVVGPLPRTRSGFKYVLTCMCYASKYPDAVPMKRADAKAIAEAMMEIFSRTGLPDEILTDKGPSFVGELGGQVCELLKIHAIRTSHYHPQTDGMLERWRASFKSMVRKSGVDSRDWDTYLKYLLFAYRSAPHTVMGFTPFELIYGRDVRGPLEMLKQGWLEGSIPEKALHEWLEQLRDRLVSMAELVSTRESASKVKMKDTYDKKSRPRELDVGSMVLMRVSGLIGKLDDSWDGPYEVVDKISPVTYQLAIPGRGSKPQTVHINMLRQWKTPDARVLRVVVADEDEKEVHHTESRQDEEVLDTDQRKELEDILLTFTDVVNPIPGRVHLL